MTISSLQLKLDSYLQLRESMGGTSGRMKSELQSFIDYLNLHGVFEPIRTHHAVDWACSNPARGASRQFQLLSLARGFMTHLKASVPETDIPPTNLIAKGHRRNPYIFSTGEINLLLQEAYRLQPLRSLRRHTHLVALDPAYIRSDMRSLSSVLNSGILMARMLSFFCPISLSFLVTLI